MPVDLAASVATNAREIAVDALAVVVTVVPVTVVTTASVNLATDAARRQLNARNAVSALAM